MVLFALVAVSLTTMPYATATGVPLASDQKIVVTGGGWGHGHGMSQYGARAQAEAGRTWRQIIAGYYKNTSIADKGNGAIRVLVSSGASVVVGGSYAYTAKWSGGSTIGSSSSSYPYMRVRPLETGVIVEKASSLSGPWTKITTGTQTPRFYPSSSLIQLRTSSGQTRYYRELIEANRRSSTLLYAINQLSMDHYLYGVVGREMPSYWHAEGLKAQAVAARSYSMWKRNNSSGVYDICATTSCQVYGGYAYTDPGSTTIHYLEADSVRSAVDATSRLAAVYNGAAIFAEYNSSSGGYTAPGSQPYLAPVPDSWDATYSPYYRWSTTIPVASIESRWPSIGRLVGISSIKRDGYGAWGGRVTSLTLVGTDTSVVVSGGTFQSAFGLRSTLFLPAVYAADVVSVPDGISISPGQTVGVSVRLKNTSNVAWQVGGGVQLGTASPLNRTSAFHASSWPSPTRAAKVTRNVTRDGASSVAPGETAEFRFALTAGAASAGVYREAFRPVVGTTTWFGSPFTITLRVGVVGFPGLGGNLLQNPSFEEASAGAPAGWSEAVGTGDLTTTSIAIDGGRSLKLVGDASLRKNFVQHLDRSGEAGDSYTLSAWNRVTGSDASGPRATTTVKFRYTDGTYDWQQIVFPAGDHSWSSGETIVTAAKTYNRIDIYTEYFEQTGTAWFDRVGLARTLVQNSGFESGTTGWSVPGKGDGRDATKSVSGIASLHLNGVTTVNALATQSVRISGGAGTRFVLSGWNRTNGTSSSRGLVFVVAALRHADGTTTFRSVSFPTAPHGWAYGEVRFATPKAITQIDLSARLDRQTGDAWFDQIRLAPEDESIVANSGFESGTADPDDWTLAGSGARDTTSPLTGTAALRLDGSATKAVYARQSIDRAGARGSSFILSGWNRSSGTTTSGGPIFIVAAVRNTDGSSSYFSIRFPTGPHGWASAATRFTATKEFTHIDLYPRIDRQSGHAWFDAVGLTPASDTLTDNSGFEAGSAKPGSWVVSGQGDGRDTSQAVSGVASLHLNAISSKNVYALQSVPAAGLGGTRFVLSGWNRTVGTTASGDKVVLVAAVRNVDGTTNFFSVSFPESAHGWTYREVELIAAKPFSHIDLYPRMDRQTGDGWFDEIRLTPLG